MKWQRLERHWKEKGTTIYLTLTLPLCSGGKNQWEGRSRTQTRKNTNTLRFLNLNKPLKNQRIRRDFTVLNIRPFLQCYLRKCHKCYSTFEAGVSLASGCQNTRRKVLHLSRAHSQGAQGWGVSHVAQNYEGKILMNTRKPQGFN